MSRKTKATVDYFPHYTKHGKTLFVLENLYGNDGYVAFYKLLELLAETDGHFYDAGKEEAREYLAARTGGTWDSRAEIITKLAKMGIIDYELWDQARVIWMQSFTDSLREAYRRRAIPLPKIPQLTDFCRQKSACDGNSDGKKPQSRVDESRVDESRDTDIRAGNTAADPIPYTTIIEHLNVKTGKAFTVNNKDTRAKIRARFKAGATLDDFIAVIDKMTLKWGNDPKMVDYLRPETLFGTKFESYLNVKVTPVDKGIISNTGLGTMEAGQEWLRATQDGLTHKQITGGTA